MSTHTAAPSKPSQMKKFRRDYQMYLFILPVIVLYVLFHYIPMYGIVLAFKNYKIGLGVWGSKWVGLENFQHILSSDSFWKLVGNTLTLSLESLFFSFPFPILLALLLHHCAAPKYKKIVQTVTYMPHFISVVVLVGMVNIFFSSSGVVNSAITALGGESVHFLIQPDWFRPLYIGSGIWAGMGWGSIIYLAALTGISPELYEAASIDGASKMQRIRYIDLPELFPIITIMLIMDAGKIMNVGFQKVFLMQNSVNLAVSEIISTYVYKIGLLDTKYSFSTAVGLLNNTVNLVLLVIVNKISRKLSETSLW